MLPADFSKMIKRGAPTVESHDITPISDTSDPLFDKRLELEIKSEAVLNFACRGQIQPIAVKLRNEKELVIVDGLQRWKRATVINHLNGHHEYRGDVGAIKEAIINLRGTSMGKRIVEECPHGMRLYVSVYRDDERGAVLAKAAANIFRQDDARDDRVRKVHQLSKHGFTHEQIAENMGISKATVTNYMGVDPDRPKQKPTTAKATRPTVKALTAIREVILASRSLTGALPLAPEPMDVLCFAAGMLSEAEFFKTYPKLKPAKKAKAA